MHHHDLWLQLYQAWRSLAVIYERSVAEISQEAGLKLPGWGLLLAVYKFEPEATTPGHLMIRSPFTAADVYRKRLLELSRKRYLQQTQRSEFRLTLKGRQLAERFIATARQAMADNDPLEEETGIKLADILSRLVKASLEADSPPNNWALALSYKIMPEKLPALPYIEQALTCLVAYRDDAHLAAWRVSGLSAMALEVLTLLWRGEVQTYEELCTRLAHRGHECEIYSVVLSELQSQSLVAGTQAEPWITALGRWKRNEIEAHTDDYYFMPWNVLSPADLDWMGNTLQYLNSHIETLAPVEGV